jgi:hypothetical protein
MEALGTAPTVPRPFYLIGSITVMIGVETARRVMFVSLDAEKVGARPQERGAPGAKLLGGGLLLGSHKADISAAGAKDKEPRLFRGSERLLLEA